MLECSCYIEIYFALTTPFTVINNSNWQSAKAAVNGEKAKGKKLERRVEPVHKVQLR